MASDLAAGSPLATALQNLVQPKLEEFGWTTGGDDTTLFDYILLMLSNGKNEEQVAIELSNDLLDEADGENTDTHRFSRWLFEQLDLLRGKPAGGQAQSSDNHMEDAALESSATAQDTEMEGVTEATEASTGTIPTGPKAMRNGSGPKQARGGRMANPANRQANDPLHRVRASQGAGRINSHSREPPKGPRAQNIGRGLEAMANGRGTAMMNLGPHSNGLHAMGGGMPPMPIPPMGQGAAGAGLNPQQQMMLMSLYEQQAQVMQQIFAGQTPQPFVNPNFQKGNKKQFTPRGSAQANRQNLPASSKFSKKEGEDENMADGSAAEGETLQQGPSTTMCHFNQRCMKADCPYVHSSPAAPKTAVVDMNDTCSYGAACKNHKCVGKHPSPAQRQQFQAQQECMFYPNCRDMNSCPYKHPDAKPCRNGADCTTPGCTFWHSSIVCKFNPCTNPMCHHKHAEGQKKGSTFKGNVWVAPKNDEEQKKDHVSERKFIDENKEEELIIPGQTAEMTGTEI